ncbi:MAG: sugar phosphate nucleotidyltransferase [Candidatus Sumerlaeia bacterium]
MDRVAALVLAGGRGMDFGPLSEQRTKSAFPVAGSYRIIDFVLSNLSHSNINSVGIVIQFLPAPLIEHVGSGRPWDYDMADRSLRIMTPFVGVSETRWFHGTGDAIDKNLHMISTDEDRDILILSGEHAYQMDYRRLLEHHHQTDADLTVACTRIPLEQQHPRFGNVFIDESGRINDFIEKPERPVSPIVSTGIYCFRRTALIKLLDACRPKHGESFNLTGDIIQPHIKRINAQAWIFNRPWFYLGNLREYFDFHMQLACGEVRLFDSSWNVMTNYSDRNFSSRTPAYFSEDSEVSDSIIASGCHIEGKVVNSVLSPGVTVGKGSVVDHCVIFHDVTIGENCRVRYAVIDKDARLADGSSVGACEPGAQPPLTVLPKGYQLAPGETIAAGAQLETVISI